MPRTEQIRSLEQENSIFNNAGKVNSVKKTVLESSLKKKKVLADVKNTVSARETINLKKKQLVYNDNPQKDLKTELKSNIKIVQKTSTEPVSCFSEKINVNKNAKDTFLHSSPFVTPDDEEDINVDECPSCFKNDADDWFNGGFEVPKFSDDDIMKICCDPNPGICYQSPSQLGYGDQCNVNDESMPLFPLDELNNDSSFPFEFQLPDEFRYFGRIPPVTW